MDNDIVTTIITAITSTLALGATGVAASLRKQLAPQRARHSMRICIVCDVSQTEAACALRTDLKEVGYQHVSLTHATASAEADCVVLWKPAKDLAPERVRQLTEAAPLGYLVLYTQDRLDVAITDRMLLNNSRLRLLSDIETVATAFGAAKR